VWNILGIACFEQRRFVPAVYAYRIAVAMEPTNYVHHYNLGLALYHVKRAPPGWFEEAAHHISIALDKNPTNEEYITTLGHIYFKLHQYENATSCYQKLLKMGNTPDPTILNLKAVASVNRMNQEFDEKSHHFVRIDPESGRMTVERDGAYFTDVAALTEVAASYKMALELKPNDAVYYYNLGNLEFGQDNLTEALRWFDKAIALDPNVAEYHSVKGLCLLELEEHEKAAKEFGIAMRLQPGNVMHPFNKGRALFKLERFFEAAQAFERAALLEPNNPNIQNWWGTALVHQGYDELAAPMFNKAAALDQNQNLYHVFFDGMLWNFGKDWQPPANYSSPAI
jgi:Flp pilus assembly protein TadD